MPEFNTTPANGVSAGISATYNANSQFAVINSNIEKYSDKIGTGDDAKSSVVWFVITIHLNIIRMPNSSTYNC
ncbi:Uncharacterised protein [Cedecea neteri]|uniref:Uncharacterized protein n=1 Tax=Cedecea neteri TaxID=158822 RepID=A0A2X3J5F6_9ENTR|nr:Uncharacterised protein [Cedecea neteri]